jgi:peptidoglycan/xylan/chitin deacetylase (PgdA/CDA1 family)
MNTGKKIVYCVIAAIVILLATACSREKPQAVEHVYKIHAATQTIVPVNPGQNSDKVVLLTFDDGPNEGLNEKILATLDKHKAKAIFFMNGPQIESGKNLVKLVHNRGHMIGNHSWDHIDLSAESKEQVEKQLGDVQKAVKDITGTAPVFFRPPFLAFNDVTVEAAKASGLTVVTSSIDSQDWAMTADSNDPKALAQRIVDQMHPGANILMHELPWTAEALDGLLSKLTELEYEFVDPHTIGPL